MSLLFYEMKYGIARHHRGCRDSLQLCFEGKKTIYNRRQTQIKQHFAEDLGLSTKSPKNKTSDKFLIFFSLCVRFCRQPIGYLPIYLGRDAFDKFQLNPPGIYYSGLGHRHIGIVGRVPK